LSAPRSTIDAEWLALPDAHSDYLGRPRREPAFGACTLATAGASACR